MSKDKGTVTFEDVEAIMEYVDKKLMGGLPRADSAKRIKAQSSANSASYLRKGGRHKVETRKRKRISVSLMASTGILRSPSISAMTTSNFVQTPSKASIVTTSSAINTSDD